MMDHSDGNNRLAKIANMLARAEQIAAELALTVLGDGQPTSAEVGSIAIVYPTEFDLYTAEDVASATTNFITLVNLAGALPTTEGLMLSRLMRLCLPGLSDDQYARNDEEIVSLLADRAHAQSGTSTRVGAKSGHPE